MGKRKRKKTWAAKIFDRSPNKKEEAAYQAKQAEYLLKQSNKHYKK